LAKKSVKEHLPLSQKIEEGFDFEGQYKKGFGELKALADKFNPDIDITPISKYFNDVRKEYAGIPVLHSDAKKIKNEIYAYSRKPPLSLSTNLKIYRSNNKKIKDIYEKSRLTGKQSEYVDFLTNLNKKIAESIEKTLPEGSPWLKQFKELNSEYKSYKDTQKTLDVLEPLLKEKVTPSSLRKFANDKKLQGKLKLAMGEKGSAQIIELAKDLESAYLAIKKIPVKQLRSWEKYLPLAVFVPFGKFVAGGKALDYAKRAYGLYLTSPQRINAYDNLLKKIISGDKEGFLKAEKEFLDNIRE